MKNKILIYGALGYTGNLFVTRALDKELPMVLGARKEKVREIAEAIGSEYRIFEIKNTADILPFLSDVFLVVNFANIQFSLNKALIEACIQSGTHYIDLGSEYYDISEVHKYHEASIASGSMLMPGYGFNLVPTDIAADIAHQFLPDANELIFGFAAIGESSRGTVKSVLRDATRKGFFRKDGKLQAIAPAVEEIQFAADGRQYTLVNNPLMGEVITAWEGTKIPSIKTYSYFPWILVQFMKGRLNWLRKFLLKYAGLFFPAGPTEKQLRSGYSYSWVEAKNADKKVLITIKGPEAYLFTVQIIQQLIRQLVKGKVSSGFIRPAFFGRELIESVEGVQIMSEEQ